MNILTFSFLRRSIRRLADLSLVPNQSDVFAIRVYVILAFRGRTGACWLVIASSTIFSNSSVELFTVFWMGTTTCLLSDKLYCMLGSDNLPLLFSILV
jgi:hypothetical protein